MDPKRKTSLSALILFLVLSLAGCATQKDLDALQRDTNNTTKELLALQRNLYDLNAEIKNLSGKMDTLGKKTDDLQQEISAISTETKTKMGSVEKAMETSSQPMRRYQADLGAQLDKLQMDLQNLMGRFEESKYFAQKTFEETKTLKENYQGKLDDLDKRMAALQKSVEEREKKIEAQEKEAKDAKETKTGVEPEEGKPGTSPAKGEPSPGEPAAKKAEKPEKKAQATPDEAYKKAYDQFTKGDTEGAKESFKKFLEINPKSKYAENAHFWLGECYFSEKKFDEAILEFDEVIKKYPKGNKVPDALFRQGMAFLEMKDSTNAKLILKEVIKRFPKSDQANRARKKLKELG
ncbi:MAG: tol-pal system protein YbgF [Deltaproteobacteria bacterium RBG_19FT_COMBO_52_11]|nr:MAG: tol-pal system protein YbgF [Deltaproteobacteria bacterium RBG_19FT_COMBO_52_11]